LTADHQFDDFIEVNDLACLRLGYGRDELLAMDMQTLIPPTYYEGFKRGQSDLASSQHTIFEVNLIRKDKRQIPVEISSHVFEYDDRPTVLSIARDITKRKKVEQKLYKTSEQLRSLASKLQTIREEERTMIAREIHDELGQVLTVLKIQISLLGNKLHHNQKSERNRIESVIQIIDKTVESVQRITAKLRPGILDELGLVPAIEWQSQDFQNQTGIQCDYSLPKQEINLTEEKSTAIFRIYQEALTNIARHSGADKVSVSMKQENEHLVLEITDNGRGILQSQVEDASSLGILGMKERALILGGNVNFYGSSGQGTNVKVEMPQRE
jgi:two-component system sensor histidine kinase UhpB